MEPRQRRRRRGLRLAALGVAFGLLVAACGDDDDSSSSATTGTTAGSSGGDTTGTTSDAPPDPITVSFVTGNVGVANLVQLQAVAAGYFEDEGIELDDLGVVPNSTQLAQTVAAGGADFATLGSAGTIAAAAADRDIVTVAVLTKEFASLVTLTDEGVEKARENNGATADSPLADRVQALRGMNIGVSAVGTSLYTVLSETLQENGLEPGSDVTLTTVADGTAMIAAARQGTIDGFIWPPFDSVLPESEGFGQVWIDYLSGDFAPLKGMPFIDLATSRSFLRDNPEAVRRMLRALWRAYEDIVEDPDGVRQLVKDSQFPDLDQDLFDRSFDIVLPAFTEHDGLVPEPDGFEPLLREYNAVNDPDSDLTFDDLYDTTLVEETRPG